MKTSRSNNNSQNKQGMSKKPKPEIRDDMDSRHRNRKLDGNHNPQEKPAKGS